MPNRREAIKFYISVEGNTEELYCRHLQSLVNNSQIPLFNLSLTIAQSKSPRKFIKNKLFICAQAFHIFDYDNDDNLFKATLKEISDINDGYKDKVIYKSGYSNISFDLWILLHKTKFASHIFNCNQYLPLINKAYNAYFESMDKYKQEEKFKKQILSKITLDDVFQAIKNANEIREQNKKTNKKSAQYYGQKYYLDNPDLTVHECIEEMLRECVTEK
ncbi:MAG: RloB family protein [Elusimicrobiota bacterium]|jgi:hypothetical protein|nr:RloB family protein [Elusimicrobiota bacterium]